MVISYLHLPELLCDTWAQNNLWFVKHLYEIFVSQLLTD